jgi:hypothetical protein
MSARRTLILSSLFILLGLVPGVAESQIVLFETVVAEGDVVPGVGAVFRIDNLAVNNGARWLVEADTDNLDTEADQVLLRDTNSLDWELYLREGQSLSEPAGAAIGSFDAVNLNPARESGWNFFLDGTSGTGDDSGIYLDTFLVIQEGNVSTAPEFTAGTPYIGFFEAFVNDGPQVLVVASVDDPAIATTVDRALVLVETDAGGALISEQVLAKEGDILAGQTETVADFGTGPHQTGFNNSGDVFFFADLNGLTTTDGALYLNDQLIAQEGSVSPDAGRLYENLGSRSLDLNNAGGTVFKADLNGSTTDDEVIIKNGSVFMREGGSVPAVAPFHFTAFGGSGPIKIGDSGKVLWFGDWDDPDLEHDTGLFLDSVLVVREGDEVTRDMVLETIDVIQSGQDAFSMSDDGAWCLFEVDFLSGLNAAVLLQLELETPVEEVAGATPRTVLRAGPSPFLSQTIVRFALPASERVGLGVYDIRGRLVATLADGVLPAGPHELTWSGRDSGGEEVPAGVYFVRLSTARETLAERIVRIR